MTASMDAKSRLDTRVVHQVEQALCHLAYGAIHLIVHDGHVVRIDRVERTKLQPVNGQPTTSKEVRHAEQP